MDYQNKIKKRNRDILNDTASIDVIDGPPKKPKMHEDGASISNQKNLIQINESCSSTQISSENIIRKEEKVLVRNDEEGIEFSHIRYFPKKPTRDLSKVDFKFNSNNFYDTNTFPRGTLTIINVNNFMKSSGVHKDSRLGTEDDAEILCNLFLELGFKIDKINNPKSTDVLKILKQAANEDYSSMSCCVVALLSYGEEGKIICTNESLNIREITNLFCTEALAGKPKFFLVESCLGKKYIESLDSVDGRALSNSANLGLPNNANVLKLPKESDFLYAYSTVLGSFSNKEIGSWFIKAVVSVFCEYAHKMDVVQLLTRVNDKVSEKRSETIDKATNNKKQIGLIISQLRKELFLPPIYGPMEIV